MEPLLEVENLYSGYGNMVILHDVKINIMKGEIVAVLGPNGAGKTTLLNSIFGLAKIFKGDIRFNGRSIVGEKPYKIVSLGVSYAPQLNNVFPNLTVEDNLLMGAYIRGRDPEIKKDIEEVFSLFPEIERRRKQFAKTLSGGERQMLAVARALMSRPKLLMLDEPTAGLAPKAASALLRKIVEIRDMGITILLVEQNVKKALEIADRAYIISSGRIVREAPAKELAKEGVEKIFFTS